MHRRIASPLACQLRDQAKAIERQAHPFTSGSETPGSQVTVSITYTFPITVALVPHNAITLSTSSTASILQ